MSSLVGSASLGERSDRVASGSRGVLAWLALILFAALPLQWFALGSTPLGTARLHQVAILGFAGIILLRYRAQTHWTPVRAGAAFLIANTYMLLCWAAIDVYHGQTPFGPVQELLYLAAFVAFSTFFWLVATGREPAGISTLRWASPAACASLLVAFSVSMLVNGINPVAVLSETIATANPELLQREVFRSAFANFGLDVETAAGNLRHEVFGAVLLAMLVSTWAMRTGGPPTPRQLIWYRASMVVGVVLLTLSLSRSILIAAAIWPCLGFLRSLVSGMLTTRQLALAFGSVAGLAALLVSGFGLVMWNRFTTDTTGYETRQRHYLGALESLRDNWLLGGVPTSGEGASSSHNFVLDAWIRGGLFTAIPAAVIVGILLWLWLRLVVRLGSQTDWVVPVIVALTLVLVRVVTVGGGLIPPVEWVAVAFVIGVLAARPQLDDGGDRGDIRGSASQTTREHLVKAMRQRASPSTM